MPVVVETKGLAPRFMDNNQVVPEYDSKGLDCDPGINASFILKVISESMGNLAIIKTARVDVFIDGEKCSDYNGMVFSEQFYAESMDGNTELIQCWHAPPMIGETFSVVKKVSPVPVWLFSIPSSLTFLSFRSSRLRTTSHHSR
tara:strand:+ start:288 stop:719 length:432 start_codon:yes stop_codon:yes gene_type:complete